MTTLYKCWLIPVIYFTCAVFSARFHGTFNKSISQELSENIDGYQLPRLQNAHSLYLKSFENQAVPSLSIRNFENLWALDMYTIPLGTMPKFKNLPNLHALSIVRSGIKFISRNVLNELLDLAWIDMNSNAIRSVANRAFPRALQVLILRCNYLTFFSESWFQSPESIKALDLSGNHIEELHEGDFALFTALHNLNLFNNHISTIGNDAFGYSSPMILHLGFNNLSHISANMFATNITVDHFLIDYNRLSFLSDDLHAKLNIKQISLDGNPWQCPCLRKMEKWTPRMRIVKTKFKFNNNGSVPNCVVAADFSDVCVPFINSKLQQFYMNSLPTLPRHMCGMTKIIGIPSSYYSWELWRYLL